MQKRPHRGSYTGYGKRLPSDKAPVMTPRELALLASGDGGGAEAVHSGSNGASANGGGPSGHGSPSPAQPAGERAGEGDSASSAE